WGTNFCFARRCCTQALGRIPAASSQESLHRHSQRTAARTRGCVEETLVGQSRGAQKSSRTYTKQNRLRDALSNFTEFKILQLLRVRIGNGSPTSDSQTRGIGWA